MSKEKKATDTLIFLPLRLNLNVILVSEQSSNTKGLFVYFEEEKYFSEKLWKLL